MKKGLLLVLLLQNLIIYGQGGWFFQNPLPGFSVYTSQMVDNQTIYICGSNGLLKKSTDGGSTWVQLFYQTILDIYQVHFIDINTGYIVTADTCYTIAKTTNAGVTWNPLYKNGRDGIYTLSIINENIIYAAGSKGGFIKTTDGGLTWIDLSIATTEAISSIFFLDENNGYIALTDNSISKTTDGGLTWVNTLISNTSANQSSLYFSDNLNGWYLGGTKLYKTTDSGDNWIIINNLPLPQISHISKFQFYDANNGCILGSYEFFKTSNGGLTWTTTNISEYPNALSSFSFFDEQIGIVIGNSVIALTSNGGETWEKHGERINSANLVGASFLDDNNGWVLSKKGELLRTHDGGCNWEIDTLVLGADFYDIIWYSSDSAWVLQDGTLYRTVDGGNTWSPKIISGTNMFKIKNSNLGWVGGYNTIYKTTNNGSTWVSSNPYPSLDAGWKNLFFVNKDVGFASYHYHEWMTNIDTIKIIKTTNGGNNWKRLDFKFPAELIGIYFYDENVGWVVDINDHVFNTTDGGNNWTTYTYNVPLFTASSFTFVNSLTGYVAGNNGTILKTTDGGATWKKQFTYSQDTFIDLCFVNTTLGWAIGSSNTILKTTDGGISNIKTDNNSIIPNEHLLYQNYPNPFNPSTTINFNIPKSGLVSLKIHDILGREVAVLINEELFAGNHSKTWVANNFCSGVYFYTLKTGSSFETRKMLLIK